jgi:hypothetical protein
VHFHHVAPSFARTIFLDVPMRACPSVTQICRLHFAPFACALYLCPPIGLRALPVVVRASLPSIREHPFFVVSALFFPCVPSFYMCLPPSFFACPLLAMPALHLPMHALSSAVHAPYLVLAPSLHLCVLPIFASISRIDTIKIHVTFANAMSIYNCN